MNKITLIGRLTREPELRYTPNGTAVAVDRPFQNQKGERQTDFIDVITWRKLAEAIANHLVKGQRVAVSGRLQVRDCEKDGQTCRVYEVVAEDVEFLDKPNGNHTHTETEPEEEPLPF
jgi:single-strand DNA-binding protein